MKVVVKIVLGIILIISLMGFVGSLIPSRELSGPIGQQYVRYYLHSNQVLSACLYAVPLVLSTIILIRQHLLRIKH